MMGMAPRSPEPRAIIGGKNAPFDATAARALAASATGIAERDPAVIANVLNHRAHEAPLQGAIRHAGSASPTA